VTAAARKTPARNADRTKKRLLQAAETEFASKGFDGARLGAIASAAGVQSALIHHYFDDKEGLYRAVVTRAVEQIARESWQILEQLPTTSHTLADVRALVAAFIDALVRFYAANAHLLAIVQREGGDFVRTLADENSRPVFDAVVAQLEDMQRRRVIRADIDPRHVCISGIALCAFPFSDEEFLEAIWDIDVRSPEFLEARKKDALEMIMARLSP
jgi:TetR/AcrR family transcriptional regulator